MHNRIVNLTVIVDVQVRRAPVDTGDLEKVQFAAVNCRPIMNVHELEQAEAELDDSPTHESAANARRLCTQQRPPVDVRASQVDVPDLLAPTLSALLSLYGACFLSTKFLPRGHGFQVVARADDWSCWWHPRRESGNNIQSR